MTFPWERYDGEYTSAYDDYSASKSKPEKKPAAKKAEPKTKKPGRAKKRS
ncbi:hypothetical protein GCM10012287_16750 [Streptomyces daqingensis]|uniref:Transcriptional regulator n=1 Tax=Streptomyces daqingensis TaxID=1472640 RepID=A0ABQ2M3H4_9ACTN|nr:hypothetical protein [Streptomyces daqingensis]GGO46433.1 hypothetical protein GCM10012287_16750 [Streptomyces daqingensis]